MKPISVRMRQAGIVLAVVLGPGVARLIWEMTYLTWREGEQMIGFTIMHVFPFLFLLWYVAYFASALWVLVVTAAFLAGIRKPQRPDVFLLACLLVLCGLPLVPYPRWQRLSQAVWGPPPLTSQRMFRAVDEDDLQLFESLLSRGMTLATLDNEGCSLLYRAVEWRRPTMVIFIVSRSGDVNRRSCRGETALFPAAFHWHVSLIRLLLGAGADPTVRNAKGQTALDVAMLSFAGDARPECRGRTERRPMPRRQWTAERVLKRKRRHVGRNTRW